MRPWSKHIRTHRGLSQNSSRDFQNLIVAPLTNWSRSLKRLLQTATKCRRRQHCPRYSASSERLEDRLVPAAVTITQVGSDGFLKGTVSADIDPATHRIATLIYIDGLGFYTKPTFDNPTTAINSNHTFQVDVVTGGLDNKATAFYVAVVPKNFTTPVANGTDHIPDGLTDNAIAYDYDIHFGRTLVFAGHTFGIKDAPGDVDPGRNHFDPRGAFVDNQGRLHLTVRFHDGFWWSSEVTLLDSLGYGTYSIQTQTDFRALDPNIVFGGFTFDLFGDNLAGGSRTREIDLEDGRFGRLQDSSTSQFVNQPFGVPGNLQRYTVPDLGSDPSLTRSFTWNENQIEFTALRGLQNPLSYPADSVISHLVYDQDAAAQHFVPSPGREQFKLNAWLFDTATAPANGQPAEIIVSNFAFTPIGGTEVSVAVAPASVSEDGASNLVYTFQRTGATTDSLTVNYTVGGSAVLTSDYSQTGATTYSTSAGTIKFAAGESSKTITIDPKSDTTVEADETVILTLNANMAYTVGSQSSATGTITNDDFPKITVAVSPASVVENGATNAIGTFSRTGATTLPLTVNFTVGGTATFNTDYSTSGAASFIESTGSVTFAVGQSTVKVTLDPTGDTLVEPNETVILGVAAGNGYTIGTANSAIATIISDDSSFSIVPLSASKAEGNSGTTPFTFTVTRNGGTLGNASVNFALTSSVDSPVQVSDFGTVFPTGTVSFTAGQSSKTITVNVKGDMSIEADEGFIVTLSNPTGGILDGATATGTILNDDTTLSIAALSAASPEGNSGHTPFTFTVTRSPAINLSSTVKYAVTGAGANAANAADFGTSFPSGTITFVAGQTSQTLAIDVLGDKVIENNEGFTVTLSAATGAVIGTATAAGTIKNDDASLSIVATSANKAEGTGTTTPFTFTVTRTGDLTVPASAGYEVQVGGANAADASDFDFGGNLPSGNIAFAAGEATQTITVDVQGDDVVESNEVFTVRILNAIGASIGTATASGTIQNDESGLSIAATGANKAEGSSGNTPFTFTVTRTGVLTGTSSVMYAVVGSGEVPADETDFGGTFPTGTIQFASGKSSMLVTINIKGDMDAEDNEGFTVMLFTPVGATLISDHTAAAGTIKNDDVLLSLVADNADQAEGDPDPEDPPGIVTVNLFHFTVTRTGRANGAVTFRANVTGFNDPENPADDPASASDFSFGGAFPSGLQTLPSDDEFETAFDFYVPVLSDFTVERDEGFRVTLSVPSGARIDPEFASAVGTIFNDDFSDAEALLMASQRRAADIPEVPVVTAVTAAARPTVLNDTERSPNPRSVLHVDQDSLAAVQKRDDDIVAGAAFTADLAGLLAALP